MANVKTITLGGAEQEVIISGQNCDIRNDGAEVIYASAKPNVTAGEDGVLAIPVGQAAKLLDSKGTVYLLGTGIVQLCGNDYSDLVFKSAPAGGGGGGTQDDIARNMASANAASISALRGDVEDVQTVAENISNPNLLINSDFNINQRGKTEYQFSVDTEGLTSNGYTYDRWRVGMFGAVTTGIVTITRKDGVITIENGCDNTVFFQQILEYNETDLGKTFTASAVIDGENVRVTFTCAEDGATYREYINGGSLGVDDAATGISVRINVGGGQTMTFAEPKLELGSVATPFTPPDPATELTKCQRYYIPATLHATALTVYANELLFLCPLPVTMRTRPSLTSDTTFRMYKTLDNVYTGDEAEWTIRVHSGSSKNGVVFALAKEAHGVAVGERYLLIATGGLSAEL